MGFVHEHSKKKIILEHPALSRTNLHRILAPYQNLEKIMIKIKHPNRERDGRIDRLYFTGTFQLLQEVEM